MIDKEFERSWREFFPLLGTPAFNLPPLATMMETAESLDTACDFVEALSPDDDSQVEQGLFVARLAIQYSLERFDLLGIYEGPGPPTPTSLHQALKILRGLAASAREEVRLGQLALGGGAGTQKLEDNATKQRAEPKEQRAEPKKPKAHPTKKSKTHERELVDLKMQQYLENNPGASIRDVSEEVGLAPSTIVKREVWQLEMARRKAEKPVAKKDHRQLTDKMLGACGETDDPAARVIKNEAIFQWLLEQASPEERAKLHMMPPEKKDELIDMSRDTYEDAHPYPDD